MGNQMSRFLAGMVCGAMLLFVVMHYHIVREDKGVVLVPKISNNLSGIYTDVRGFKLQDWKNHRALAAAIMRSSHSDVIADSAHRDFGESIRRRVDEFLGS